MSVIDVVARAAHHVLSVIEGTSNISNSQVSKCGTREEIVSGLASLISDAREEILISTGQLLGSLYEDPQILRAIKKAKRSRVAMKVLVGPDYDGGSPAVDILREYTYVIPEPPLLHFAVIDQRHVRLEPPHHPGTLPANRLARDVPATAAELRTLFMDMTMTGTDDEAVSLAVWEKKQAQAKIQANKNG